MRFPPKSYSKNLESLEVLLLSFSSGDICCHLCHKVATFCRNQCCSCWQSCILSNTKNWMESSFSTWITWSQLSICIYSNDHFTMRQTCVQTKDSIEYMTKDKQVPRGFQFCLSALQETQYYSFNTSMHWRNRHGMNTLIPIRDTCS